MNSINLKLLQTFLLAAEHGSFRRAADESQRSPSAVSMQIRDLEAQLGTSLFLRTPQRACLTPEGQILFDQISRAMSDVQAGLDRLKDLSSQRRGHVRLACAPTLASTRLGDILATFRLRYPRSRVEVHETPPAAALTLLQNQEVEFYIGPEIPNLTEFEFEPLLRDRFVACVPPEFDDGAAMLALADLGRTPVILLDSHTAIRTLIDTILAQSQITLNVQYEVQHAQTALALAGSGLGVAIVPGIAIHRQAAAAYRAVPLSDPAAVRSVGILCARGYVRQSYSEQLMHLIRGSLGEAR